MLVFKIQWESVILVKVMNNRKRTSLDGIIKKNQKSSVVEGVSLENNFKNKKSQKNILPFTKMTRQDVVEDRLDDRFFSSSSSNSQPYELTEEAKLNLEEDNGYSVKQSFWERRKLRRENKAVDKKTRRKIKLKVVVLFFFIALLLVGGVVVYRIFQASGNVFQGGFFQVFQKVPLKQDENGRSNFLILGTSEDDPGHEGANLTDSMMIVSVDQKKKDVYLFSIPRDLYVKYDRLCFSGQSGKINAYLYCVNDEETATAEQERLTMSMRFISDIFGLELHYAVRVNYTVLREAVDAVGGVDVNIQGSGGAPGILDRHFDHVCDYKCYLVKYDNGVHHLDGSQALNLARVRGESAPTYGLVRSNFDREINQQKILVALKDKAVKTSTIMDFNKVLQLVDALGNNLRTNIQTKELRTLLELSGDIESSKIHRISLIGDGDDLAVLKTDGGNVVPIEGYFNYDGVKKFIQKKMGPKSIETEEPIVDIFNNSAENGLAQAEADRLTGLGFTVGRIDNLPERAKHQPEGSIQVYSFNPEKSFSAEKLKKMYSVKVINSRPEFFKDSTADFVVIINQRAED